MAIWSRFFPKRLINVRAIRYDPPASATSRPIMAPNPKTMISSPMELPIPSLIEVAILAGFMPSPSATNTEVTISETKVFNFTRIIKKSKSKIPKIKTTNCMLNSLFSYARFRFSHPNRDGRIFVHKTHCMKKSFPMQGLTCI